MENSQPITKHREIELLTLGTVITISWSLILLSIISKFASPKMYLLREFFN